MGNLQGKFVKFEGCDALVIFDVDVDWRGDSRPRQLRVEMCRGDRSGRGGFDGVSVAEVAEISDQAAMANRYAADCMHWQDEYKHLRFKLDRDWL